MWEVLAGIVTIGSLLWNPFHTPTLDLTRLQSSIAKLDSVNTRAHCTAWLVNSEKKYWVSASHCYELVEEVATIKGRPASLLWADTQLDVMVLWADTVGKALTIDGGPLDLSDPLAQVGYPADLPLSVFRGKPSNLSVNRVWHWSHTFVMDIDGGPGMSGSPILNRDLKVVGMHLGSLLVQPYASVAIQPGALQSALNQFLE